MKSRLFDWLVSTLLKKASKQKVLPSFEEDKMSKSRLRNWLVSTLLKKRQKAIIQPLQLSFALPNGNITLKGGGMLDTVYVCTHALDRWRERASEYAMAPEEEVIEILRQARKIAHDEFLPVPREQGIHYYFHQKYDAYFVVEPINRTSCRVVTVIVPGAPKNYVLPKKKVKKPKATVQAILQAVNKMEEQVEERIHITPAQADPDTLTTLEKVMKRIMPEETEKLPDDEWEKRVLEYRRYVNMMHEIERRLSTLTRNQPIRRQLVAQLGVIKEKLAVLKPDYRRYINDLNNRAEDEPIRADGSVNYVAAILHLMKKTDEQQKEIEELKTAVAFLSSK